MNETYEDRWGPIERRLRRAARALRWRVKGLFRIERRVLVELRWRLGDEIMALPMYRAIARAFAPCTIEILCNYPELLETHAKCLPVDASAPDPDRYVLLRSDARSKNRLEHYARLAGIPVPHDRPAFPVALSPTAFEDCPVQVPYVVFAPGASWPAKRWPAEHWRVLAEKLRVRGFRVIELGNSGEAVGAGADFTGGTTITGAATLLGSAALVVANDSGLMHLALATRAPVIALFGPTTPEMLVRADSNFLPLANGRACAGCWNGSMEMTRPGVCPRGVACCMETLTVDKVLAAVQALSREDAA